MEQYLNYLMICLLTSYVVKDLFGNFWDYVKYQFLFFRYLFSLLR